MIPFEFKRENVTTKENPLDNIEFCDVPLTCSCPHCNKPITTTVEFHSGCLTFVLCFLAFLCLGWVFFCVVPFIFPLLQDCCHYCPRCLNLLSRQKRIRLPKIANEIMTVKCGSCAIVLSRKYVIFFFIMASLIMIANSFRWYFKHFGFPELPSGPVIDHTWEDFIADCGLKSSLGNPIHATAAFVSTYYQNNVLWEGQVNKITEGRFANHYLYITMEDTQFPLTFRESPDLALVFPEHLSEKVAKIKLYDEISFEATLLELGRRGRPHVGVLRDLSVLSNHNDLLPAVHNRNMSTGPGFFHMAQQMNSLPNFVRIIRITPMSGNGSAIQQRDNDNTDSIDMIPNLIQNIFGSGLFVDEDEDDDSSGSIGMPRIESISNEIHHLPEQSEQITSSKLPPQT